MRTGSARFESRQRRKDGGPLDLDVRASVLPTNGLGPTQFPMRKAYVYSVFPSLYQSWKISTPSEVVGTIEQDRTAAISGKLGRPPRMIPVTVALDTSRQEQRPFAFRIVEDDLFSPLLTYLALASVLQANERAFGTASIRVGARLRLGNGREVRVEDLFAQDPLGQEQPALQAAALVAAPLAYLLGNDFERVSVESVQIEVAFFESIQTATLERAWLDRSGPVRPGSTVPSGPFSTFLGPSIAPAAASGPPLGGNPLTLSPEIRQAFWSQLEAGILGNLQPGATRLNLSLDPPQLGHIELTLNLKGEDLAVTAVISRPEVAHLAGAGMEQLVQALSQQGLILSQFQVSLKEGGDPHLLATQVGKVMEKRIPTLGGQDSPRRRGTGKVDRFA